VHRFCKFYSITRFTKLFGLTSIALIPQPSAKSQSQLIMPIAVTIADICPHFQFAPPPPYDYHQPLPIGDSESGQQDFGNCSICMEPILVNQIGGSHNSDNKQSLDDKSALASTATNMGAVGSRVMNINFRRTYALAPCHHLFHTDCLSQWMAIKVSKRLASSVSRPFDRTANSSGCAEYMSAV
jgi:hypothetical protein